MAYAAEDSRKINILFIDDSIFSLLMNEEDHMKIDDGTVTEQKQGEKND